MILGHDAGLYGAQHSLLDILRRIDRNRFEPLVFVPTRGPFIDALAKEGLHAQTGVVQRWVFHPKPMLLWEVLRYPWRLLKKPHVLTIISLVSLPIRVVLLARIVRSRKIRLIYTNTITVLDGAIVARLCGIPHVWHLREALQGNKDLILPLPTQWITRLVLEWSSTVITNSLSLAKSLFGETLPANVHVVHNGVDPSSFDSPPSATNLPSLPAGARVAMICGAIHERKDQLTYVRAASRLRYSHPLLHHLVVGKGSRAYCDLVQEEIDNCGMGDHIHFLGFRSDIPALMSFADLIVSCSRQEPFGRTLIEAMAAGKPVIATRSGGPEEIVVDGECGFLVGLGDDAAIAKSIALLLDDSCGLSQMGNAARSRVLARFDLRVCVSRIELIFDSVLKRAG
jgi:glycosyltransferase involved in cell wall biosynthesis